MAAPACWREWCEFVSYIIYEIYVYELQKRLLKILYFKVIVMIS